MQRMHNRHGAMTLLVIALLVGLLILAFSAPAGAAKKSRPFKGHVHGTSSYVPSDQSPTGMYAYSDAVGRVSHMGASVMAAMNVAQFTFEGDMTLTAANGATVAIYYTGGSDPADLPPVGESYDVPMEGTIVGGTGRFAGATGFVDMTMSVQFMGFEVSVWPADWTWQGKIKY